MKRLKLAGIGCGSRTLTYLVVAMTMPDRYEVVAAADPVQERVERIREISRNPDFRCFRDDKELLAQPKLADVVIIGTQDRYHFEPCLRAMEKGYDVLLEKPIATSLHEVIELEKTARRLGRKVLVCHIMRYVPSYQKIKEIIDSGVLGEIITVHASESVGTFHHAHSFVRGHWAVVEKASPMIVAKCCHDMDVLSWLLNRKCLAVASYGNCAHFNAGHAPAGAPDRCTDGCPVGSTCIYNALRYISDRRSYLSHVYDKEQNATPKQITAWLAQSPWGRCVYRCDNTTVDHQVIAMNFEGGATATFSMTAFGKMGRTIEIYGTRGQYRTGDIENAGITLHNSDIDPILPKGGDSTPERYASHAGGDPGLMITLYDEMMKVDPSQMHTSIHKSVESHLMAFAAEASRVQGQVVNLEDFYKQHA